MTRLSKTRLPRFQFRDKGILPTGRMITALGLLSIPLLAAASRNTGWQALVFLNMALILLSLLDLFLLPKHGQLECRRELPEELERGIPFTVRLVLRNLATTPIRFQLKDSLPTSFLRPFPLHGELGGKAIQMISYESSAAIRGNYDLDRVYMRYRSRLGLWEKQTVFLLPQHIRVIPNMSHVKGCMASARRMLLLQGNKPRKYQRGLGEFSLIRHYAIGDDPRKINWRATARQAEIMTNVHEPEHGKQVTLLLDCGRTMGVELTEGNRLERSLEAMLTVAAVALQQGDYVSVLAFSHDIHAYIPPGKGLTHLHMIIREVYHLQSTPVESNYAKAFQYLETVQKRRALIMLFSDLDHYLLDDVLLPYLQPIRKRHLFLWIGITDPMIREWIEKEPTVTRAAMVKSMAQRQALERKKDLLKWGQLGLQATEAHEEQVVTAAIERYIEIINRGLL